MGGKSHKQPAGRRSGAAVGAPGTRRPADEASAAIVDGPDHRRPGAVRSHGPEPVRLVRLDVGGEAVAYLDGGVGEGDVLRIDVPGPLGIAGRAVEKRPEDWDLMTAGGEELLGPVDEGAVRHPD